MKSDGGGAGVGTFTSPLEKEECGNAIAKAGWLRGWRNEAGAVRGRTERSKRSVLPIVCDVKVIVCYWCGLLRKQADNGG